MAATTPESSQADISAAVRMCATIVKSWIDNHQYEKFIMNPNTVSFLAESMLANTNPVLVDIPDTEPGTLLKFSFDFEGIGETFDEEFGTDE